MKLRPQPAGPVPKAAPRIASRVTRHASRPAAGVALIITLIMISVITFMAIAFLALSRREKGQVATTTDQLTASLACDAARERAMAQLLASISATTNLSQFDLLVSTNFNNPNGYFRGVDAPTNVNYEAAAALNSRDEQLRNLANLLYSPRVPVFVTNKFYRSNEFRFYLDLNRDGTYTTNGWGPVISGDPANPYYDTNGATIPSIMAGRTLSNYFTGDPEFIGILRRPERTHSADNEFLSRYAFLVLPAGRTLDVNYIHNYARLMNSGLATNIGDGFRRNQGVVPAEINLASFLVDLNTNAWPGPNQNSTPLGFHYQYTPDGGPNAGAAFDDAVSFLRYRYAGNYQNLRGAGFAASALDGIDVYARSPLMSNVFGLTLDRDVIVNSSTPYWHGSENPNHFFTSQDFFDAAKLPPIFSTRLRAVATNQSSYDRYTYYRLLAQLGTDSSPESDTEVGRKAPWDYGLGKLDLNYVNVGGWAASNAIPWNDPLVRTRFGRPGSEVFFYHAADRLVRRYSEEWRDLNYRSYTNLYTYTNTFGTDQPFGASRIPVFVNGRFVYSPSLHRQLQLAANLYDAVNPSFIPGTTNAMPTVFRPIFTRTNGNIYITDFKEVTRFSDIQGLPMRDLANTNIVASVQPNDLLFGVPLIIGARSGLPNFNEFSSEAVISVTRKVELRRSVLNGPINQTNQMFVIGISNVFGAEFWNSYTKIYPRPVEVLVTNFCTLSLTNDFLYTNGSHPVFYGSTNVVAWPAWRPNITQPQGPWSFIVPMRTNHILVPESTYRHSTHSFVPITGTFESPQAPQLWFPRWGLTITNRLLAIIKEPGAGGRIIDYVQLNGMISHRNFSEDLVESRLDRRYNDNGVYGIWATNSPDGIHLGGYPGIDKQVRISLGDVLSEADWMNNTAYLQSGATKYQAIANFLYFMKREPYYQANDGRRYVGTNTGNGLVATAPFSPTSKRSIPIIYQANDPLVHYTSGDLEYLEKTGVADAWTPPTITRETLPNLGRLNVRYRPWGNYPNSPADDPLVFQTVVKDPGVTRSGDWRFPTNMLPTLGWIGRVHRGTPWQTLYLKSSRVADAVQAKSLKASDWQNWTGNRHVWTDRYGRYPVADPLMTQPETDRACLDLFTTAVNDNATRGQLPINQSGLAAWSAVFGGLVALTNSTPDAELVNNAAPTGFGPVIIDPAGAYDPANARTWTAVATIVQGINTTRTNRFANRTFRHLGDLLDTPELTERSPFLNLSRDQKEKGLTDAVYEWLPQQMLSLVRLGEPRFVIYSFGQTLKAAPKGLLAGGNYSGLITNYQVTAEVATRAVVRVVGSPDPETLTASSPKYQSEPDKRYPLRIVVENFNVLPPD